MVHTVVIVMVFMVCVPPLYLAIGGCDRLPASITESVCSRHSAKFAVRTVR